MTTTLRRHEDAHPGPSLLTESARRWAPRLRPWVVLVPVLLAWITVFTPYARYLDWDEAAFYGQSGGYDGAESHAPYMAASREHGTPLFIGVLRIFARDLPSTRMLWTVMVLVLVVAAFAVAERHAGRHAGLVGAAVFTTFWVATMFFAAFLSTLPGAAAALLTTGVYLELRKREPSAAIRLGVLLGICVALMFAFRNLESLLVSAVLITHAVVWRPRWLVQRWHGIVAAVATFGVVFILPWTLHTTEKYGSVMARVAQARSQGHPFGVYNGLGRYGRALLGRMWFSNGYDPGPPPPAWTSVVLVIGLLLVVVGIALLVWRRAAARFNADVDDVPGGHTGLFLTLSAVTFGLFFFLSQSNRHHYMMFGLIFGSVVVGQAVTAAARWVRQHVPRRRHGAVVAAVAVFVAAWLAAQGVLTYRVQMRRYGDAQHDLAVATIIDSLAKGERCLLFGQAAKPQFVVATGCRSRGGRGPREVKPADPLRDRLLADYPESAWRFALWRPRHDDVADIVEDWPRIDQPDGVSGWVLSYRPPPS